VNVTWVTPLGKEAASTWYSFSTPSRADALAEQDRHHHDVHVVDKSSGKEGAGDGGTSADISRYTRIRGRGAAVMGLW
jgi:hypothetical protein